MLRKRTGVFFGLFQEQWQAVGKLGKLFAKLLMIFSEERLVPFVLCKEFFTYSVNPNLLLLSLPQ
jgi:hypothetical protein